MEDTTLTPPAVMSMPRLAGKAAESSSRRVRTSGATTLRALGKGPHGLQREHTRRGCIFFVHPLNMSVATLDCAPLEQGLHGVTPLTKQPAKTHRDERNIAVAMDVLQGQHVHACMP